MPFSRFVENTSSARVFPVRVNTMDAELTFEDIKPKATGRDLLEITCRNVGLREIWYFGLQFVDSEGDMQWVRDTKKIADQAVLKDNARTFTLMVKFFPEDVSEIIQEVTRHLFFLQVKQLILNADIYCPPEATVLLASYAVQAKYGDYDEKTYRPEMLATEDLLPQRVIDQYQMTPDMWAEKIKVWYEAIRGMLCEEAEVEYLKIAQDLEMYGISYFKITNEQASDIWLGVSATGLFIFEQDNRLTAKCSFTWGDIKDVSYSGRKFIVKMTDKKKVHDLEKKAHDRVFIVQKLKTNKMILDLCIGNHEMYIRRRKPDSVEVQQLKSQAREEKSRRQIERAQLEREKMLRLEAQREKEELQTRMRELQEQFRLAQEAVVRSEEAADLLAEKVRIAEEESALLQRKAAECEKEKQRLKLAAMKTEEEKLLMERRARDAELIANKIVEECDRRFHETQQLKTELLVAKLAEKAAREKYQDFMRTSSLYGSVNSLASIPSYSVAADVGASDYRTVKSPGPDLVDFHVSSGSDTVCDLLPASVVDGNKMPREVDKDRLDREIEVEKGQYIQQSQSLREQLKAIRSEIDSLKVEDKQSHFDNIHEQNLPQGANKITSPGKARSTPSKQRIQFYEEL